MSGNWRLNGRARAGISSFSPFLPSQLWNMAGGHFTFACVSAPHAFGLASRSRTTFFYQVYNQLNVTASTDYAILSMCQKLQPSQRVEGRTMLFFADAAISFLTNYCARRPRSLHKTRFIYQFMMQETVSG